MKKTLFSLIFVLLSSVMMAGSFVRISYAGRAELEKLFADPNLTVHYYNDNEVYATASAFDAKSMTMLDENAFQNNDVYTLVYCPSDAQDSYLVDHNINALVKMDHAILAKGMVMPYKNDGAVAIFNKEARLPRLSRDFPTVTVEDPRVREMMDQVDMDSLEATVQHLQDYGGRFFNSNNAYAASDWIAGKMAALGLEVEQQDFVVSGSWVANGPAAPNVIGIQRGTLYPDTYVVCGSHFDSFTWDALSGINNGPGADDNATGVASVLESARIMSQYEFEYSIVYCAYGAEELGLYGSEAYASRCQQQNMDIIGYFNNDMNGYLYGDVIHIDCIYPNNVAPIGNYYMNVANIYFPEMPVHHADLTGGDSDHTSFNNHGYMGIYPFEDVNHDSPYIHTTEDLIGPSVNSFGMSQRYCQMNIGCLAEIARLVGETPVVECNPVVDFAIAEPISKDLSFVVLEWQAPKPGSTGELERFDIYRDGQLHASVNNEVYYYEDTISVGLEAEYYIMAVYSDGCEAASETLIGVGNPSIVNESSCVNPRVYPNPVKGELTVKADGLRRVIIYNAMGQQVAVIETKQDECLIPMDYPRGLYSLQLVTEKGVATKNVVVR